MKNLTNVEMWNRGYISRNQFDELALDWRNHCNRLIAEKLEEIGLNGKRVLEIGAGDSQWLTHFARKYPSSRFGGLDYSMAGCERLSRRVAAAGGKVSVAVYHQDVFAAESALHGKFDLIVSFGVVEHFSDLSHALLAKRNYLNEHGMMFTLIPNMAGSIGFLTRLFNCAVYERHNPHDSMSFLEGHRKAGMTVLSGGYLGSTNFGVLSSCFNERRGLSWHAYVLLTRLSKAIGYVECKLGDFPVSKAFSPYIYAISRKA
ncbi:MAG: SAM-dependent methyltransferase [Gammaproteobacteria bacterium]